MIRVSSDWMILLAAEYLPARWAMRSLLSIWARDVRTSKSPLVLSIPVRSSILIKSNVGGRIASGSSATLPRVAMILVMMGDALLSVEVGSHNVISISAGAAQTCAILEGGNLSAGGITLTLNSAWVTTRQEALPRAKWLTIFQ